MISCEFAAKVAAHLHFLESTDNRIKIMPFLDEPISILGIDGKRCTVTVGTAMFMHDKFCSVHGTGKDGKTGLELTGELSNDYV
jgi:hypothetical protein